MTGAAAAELLLGNATFDISKNLWQRRGKILSLFVRALYKSVAYIYDSCAEHLILKTGYYAIAKFLAVI